MYTSFGAFLALLVADAALAAHTTKVEIPKDLKTRALVRDVVGYSLEPTWVSSYASNKLAATLLQHIADLTGKAPPIRVGGNSADQTHLVESLPDNKTDVMIDTPKAMLNITMDWYDDWANYFPETTDIIYSLNFADTTDDWAIAMAQAEKVHSLLGDKLTMFELGNEIDHFIAKGWRNDSWGVMEYAEQFRELTGAITNTSWYRQVENPPTFQAGVFADPPWVPDQHDEIDDFDIVNLTTIANLTDVKNELIEAYSTHLYPQSTCDPVRWHRMRLDLLSDHHVLWRNVSQYIPQVAAADAVNTSLVMGETNSVSCSGKSGISDTLGAALWTIDYVLMAASIGFEKIYFHLGAHSEYSAFTPEKYTLKGEELPGGIRPNWYSHYFIAKAVQGRQNEKFEIAALPGANESDFSGYAVYSSDKELRKLVFLDMGVWNGTEGLSNPSTLKATDGTSFSEGERPKYDMSITTPWSNGGQVSITRLVGPGTNAKSQVNVSGITFDPETGKMNGEGDKESVEIGQDGVVSFSMKQAEAVLIEMGGPSDGSSGGDEGSADDKPGAAGTLMTPGLFPVAMGFMTLLLLW